MNQQRVLVLGASGHIGQNLIPALIKQGHQVTAGARRVDWMMSQGWENTRCIFVDLHNPETLNKVMHDTDIVYYLVHSMGDAHNLVEQERKAAINVVEALEGTKVKQIIFLSALQHKDQQYSPHLIARKLTGEVLRTSTIPVTEIRTSMIVGPGSAPLRLCVIWFITFLFLRLHAGFAQNLPLSP
ncbi:short chain dehydrogenase [Proteus vulgaris]|nr:short chain dehydrogenase [Proteus vulgaris]